MDPRFVADPSEAAIAESLRLWPELAGKRIRPLLVTAFGTIFVETDSGEVLAADPIELTCEQAAESVDELKYFFTDREWSEAALLVNLALSAYEKGVTRRDDQVFAVAPHPCFTGKVEVENLMPMELQVWHHISAQTRGNVGFTGGGA
jgi:hypothetical protein